MNRKLSILSLMAMLSLCSQAQEGSYRYANDTQLWRLTNNAAGLGLDSTQNRGFALFNGEHQSGDYARVQEGDQTNQLRFQTERYQTVGRYLHAYGRFDFDYGRTKNRAWSDVMRPFDGSPYVAGSSVSGKYDFQDFDFTAALGSVDLGGWRFGLRLDYAVGDLSRLRDPRSRSQLLNYKLSPAITRTMGNHTFGLSGSYNRRKEKITGVTTVQQDPNLKYYIMTGMEHAEGITGGYSSFGREWVDHRFGAELSYQLRRGQSNTLLTVSIERGEESAYGQYKYEPGRYIDYRYAFNAHFRDVEGDLTHLLDLHTSYKQAYADEYNQQLQQVKDPQSGYTTFYYTNLLTFKKRYQVEQFQASMRYRALFTRQQEEHAYVGFSANLQSRDNSYILPSSSLKYGGTTLLAEGGMALIPSVWIDATAGGYLSQQSSLSLNDATTEYAQQVLLSDMTYYSANYWTGRLSLTYQFPLNIKGQQSLWFVRAYGQYLRANHQLDAKCIGISIGLYN